MLIGRLPAAALAALTTAAVMASGGLLTPSAEAAERSGYERGVVAFDPEPHPLLAGTRLSAPHVGVHLVDPHGYRRGIPGPAYERLFRGWEGIKEDLHLDLIAAGPDLSADAFLVGAQEPGYPDYIFTNGKKYGITSGAVMDKYYFDRKKVRRIPAAALVAIPDGGIWE